MIINKTDQPKDRGHGNTSYASRYGHMRGTQCNEEEIFITDKPYSVKDIQPQLLDTQQLF